MTLLERFTQNINNIIGVSRPSKIGVAVSGGPDSVALLHLTVAWAKSCGLQVVVFSVDHSLRAEAKLEVSYVGKLADKLGCRFVPLHWEPGGRDTRMQERARQARYDLMSAACKKLSTTLLLTAHHLDDMLETYSIKKSKKTSEMALSANITHFWDDIWIARPLFNIEKKELIDYLQKDNISWFEDKSNSSVKYERNRIRKQLATFNQEQKAELLAEYNLANVNAADFGRKLIKSLAETVEIYNYGFAKINIRGFNSLDEEIKIHVLNYVLTIVSGKTIIPRFRNLSNILTLISAGALQAATLSHCRLVSTGDKIIIYKEKAFVAREGVGFMGKVIWDKRFELVSSDASHDPSYFISYLGVEDYLNLKKDLDLEKLALESDNRPREILFTLPVIKNLEKVVAIPHISYYDIEAQLNQYTVKTTFKPAFISRFTHFF